MLCRLLGLIPWTCLIPQVRARVVISMQNMLFPSNLASWANRVPLVIFARLATISRASRLLMGRSALRRRFVLPLNVHVLVLRWMGRLMLTDGTLTAVTTLLLKLNRPRHLALDPKLKLLLTALLPLDALLTIRGAVVSSWPHLWVPVITCVHPLVERLLPVVRVDDLVVSWVVLVRLMLS